MRARPTWATRITITAIVLLLAVLVAAQADDRGSLPNSRKLPSPQTDNGMSLAKAIAQRRSIRRFTEQSLAESEIGQLAWAAQGLTGSPAGSTMNFRAAPSAGALYPLELYLVTREGVHHYVPRGHRLKLVMKGDLRQKLSRAALGQQAVAEAALNVVIAGVNRRTTRKYRQRGVRYVYMEVGHAAQNVLLQATALGLGAVPIGAFEDGKIDRLLRLPKGHKSLYIVSIGHPRR